MADGHDDRNERDDEQLPLDEGRGRSSQAARPGGEGVRILGAEEAQAALETGAVSKRLDDDAVRYGDVPPRPDPAIRPTVSFPRPANTADEAATWSASESEPESLPDEGQEPMPAEPSSGAGPVALPHWTEPPTGEVPQILPESDVGDETAEQDLDTFAAATGRAPRFHTSSNDWVEEDFEGVEALGEVDDVAPLGALAERPAEGDEDAAFERDVQARRRSLPRTVSSRPTERPAVAPAGRRARGRPTPIAPLDEEDFGAPEHGEPDLATRVITGLGVAVLALFCLWLGRGPTAALATVIVGLAAFELFQALQGRGFRPASVLGVLGAIAMVPIAYNRGQLAFTLVPALVLVFTMLWYLFEVVRARTVVNIGVTLLAFMYVGFLGGFAGLMLAYQNGVGLILGVAICAVGYDVGGYFIGSQFGKNRLAPEISPNKTMEGLIGGMALAFLLAVLVVSHITPWKGDLGHAIGLGLTVAIAAPLGDLCESLLKRDLGIKDVGSILPGHGGVLDRFDAILFSLPAVYFLVLAMDVIKL